MKKLRWRHQQPYLLAQEHQPDRQIAWSVPSWQYPAWWARVTAMARKAWSPSSAL